MPLMCNLPGVVGIPRVHATQESYLLSQKLQFRNLVFISLTVKSGIIFVLLSFLMFSM